MLRIEMPRKELTIAPKVFAGFRERYSCATAVAFITENLLVSAAFNSRKLYLIELTENGHNILQEVKTNHSPDLMKYKDGMILTSDYPYMEPNGHGSIYDLIDGKIVFRKEIPIINTKIHGCGIIDHSTIILTNQNVDNKDCLFIDVPTGNIIKRFKDFDYYPKDTFVFGDRILIICAGSIPDIGKKVVTEESVLYLFDKDLKKLDEMRFFGQTDSLTLTGEDGFVTIQTHDEILHFNLINDKLSIVKRIKGFDFPHGVDSFEDKVAVTNYGDNTIRIFTLDELKSL
jgi:hypothetical protein